MRQFFLIVFGVILGFSSLSCGYSTRSALPGSLQTIHIKPFENKIDFAAEGRRNIYLPLLEVDTRNAVIDRYLFDGNMRVVEKDPDLILTGSLIGYRRDALRYDDNDDVQEYRVQIVVNLRMMDTETNELLWQEDGFVGEGFYFVSGPRTGTEEQAVREAILDFARRVVERTVENW